jgi:tetratricopeptide (TPR) repeat protein
VDISDWLTKILVGVGLVELNKIPHNLRLLAIFLGPGLRSDDTPHYVASSETFALGIVLFFFGAGFLIGYLWTRLYFQTALSELADLAHRVEKAWFDATNAEILLEEGRLDDAMRAVDSALKVGPANAKALFTKGRILKRLSQAGGVPGDKALLREALDYATRAARLIPNKGGPLYNMACYQALLGDAAVALKALRQAIQLNPRLKDEAVKDEDLASLRELDEFKALTSSPATSN